MSEQVFVVVSSWDDGYTMSAVFKTGRQALYHAIALVGEHVEGGWNCYHSDEVRWFKHLVSREQFGEALDVWNGMTGYCIEVRSLSVAGTEQSMPTVESLDL